MFSSQNKSYELGFSIEIVYLYVTSFCCLQQTLRTALEKNTHSEDTMKILACQMQEKVNSLDQLKRECCNISRDEKYGAAAINDLDVFARNEGGLIGVVREIKEIQQILQVHFL